ncbi:MAG: nucleotidyl transferase AbiEii/AbiGii toxin family protein [Planctomycetota bacterium]|nr:MAG: nucleotidyl transferase AbiEii/AbiGii toxin family protein [Planctomycetota bacterium]
MKSLFRAAAELQDFLLEHRWQFCFTGGIALQRRGQPRLTIDIDVSLLTGIGGEQAYVDVLCGRYQPRIPNAREFALQNRVLLLITDDRIPLDIALAGFPFEELVIQRATDFQFLKNVKLRTCSAEDLIVLKAFADRSRDWADIETILIRQTGSLDRDYIADQLAPLCDLKKEPQILKKLNQLFDPSA